MKKYILYLLTGMAACSFCGCEEALDRFPKDRLTPDEFFHTEEECELYTNDFYTIFPSGASIYNETADIITCNTLTSEVLGNRTVPAILLQLHRRSRAVRIRRIGALFPGLFLF